MVTKAISQILEISIDSIFFSTNPLNHKIDEESINPFLTLEDSDIWSGHV